MAVVITACSGRKRAKPTPAAVAANLPRMSVDRVARIWSERLSNEARTYPSASLYCGRGFAVASEAARALSAKLHIVSAGLATVAADSAVPAYSLTVASGSPDNVLSRVDAGSPSPSDWWRELTAQSPFGSKVSDVIAETRGLVLLALPASYLGMIAEDLFENEAVDLERLRIFSLSDLKGIDARYRKLRMPYDSRLEGPDSPIPGTRSDFASRAMQHFVAHILPGLEDASADEHGAEIEEHLKAWRHSSIPVRKRLSDQELSDIIRDRWGSVGGRSSHLLRVLRDELGVACEQSRFKDLFAQVKADRELAQ